MVLDAGVFPLVSMDFGLGSLKGYIHFKIQTNMSSGGDESYYPVLSYLTLARIVKV